MILRVPVPDGWTSKVVDDGILHELGSTTIHALHIRELPVDALGWMRNRALAGAPAGTTWTQRLAMDLTTVGGWPAGVIEVELAHASFQQTRLVAFYQFRDYAAGAIVSSEPARFAELRGMLLDLLGDAWPDWGPQATTCLTRLFEGASMDVHRIT